MSNSPTPSNNPNPLGQFSDLVIRLLTNPTIFQYASRHPVIANIITALLLSLSGLSFFQVINFQNFQSADSAFIHKVCVQNEEALSIKINERLIGISWTFNESNNSKAESSPNNSTLSFTCQYKIKSNNIILPQPQELLITPRIDSLKEEILNSQNVCDSFTNKVKERLDIGKEGNEFTGDPSVEEYKGKRKINQLSFFCRYQTQKDNNPSDSKDISVELHPLFTDLITESYDEKIIDMNEVCKDETIIKQMKEKARKGKFYNEAAGDEIVPGKPLLLEKKKDIYPVFRWVCSYNINRIDQEDNKFTLRTDYNLDLYLEPYCENKARKRRNKSNKTNSSRLQRSLLLILR